MANVRADLSTMTSLRAVELRLGPQGAAKLLHVDLRTLTRAMAGMGVHRATLAQLRCRLVEIAGEVGW